MGAGSTNLKELIMANIGTFTKTGNEYKGEIVTISESDFHAMLNILLTVCAAMLLAALPLAAQTAKPAPGAPPQAPPQAPPPAAYPPPELAKRLFVTTTKGQDLLRDVNRQWTRVLTGQ